MTRARNATTDRKSIRLLVILTICLSLTVPASVCHGDDSCPPPDNPASGRDQPAAEQSPISPAARKRLPWTTSRVSGTPEPPPPLREQIAYPEIRFSHPVVLIGAPDSDRWFVGEQTGRIYSFPQQRNSSQADLFLDVGALLTRPPASAGAVDNSAVTGLEALYGLTFHPQFAANRFVYVCYVVQAGEGQHPDGTRVSRFSVAETEPPRAIPESEEVLITWLQGGHNGGCLAFGPEGYLYISTGDGGFANPPDGRNAGQDVGNLLSSVLRIDVDHPDPATGRKYTIPADNPFVDLPGARGEIWCYGLRNPWKMKFDRATGDLWVGDVGWELWELVFRVQRAGNYGWSVVEGRQSVHPERKIGPTPILPPAIEIPHTDGVSITGGYVYRGSRFPELYGSYIWGDWETRRIWAAKYDEASRTISPMRDVVDSGVRLVDFAEDNAGELYLLDYDAGTIHELVRNPAAAANLEFPTKLSETGLFQELPSHKPAAGVFPFEINVEQWADHATSTRFIGLPGQEPVRFFRAQQPIPGSMFQSSMLFPPQTVLARTFFLELTAGNPQSRRPIETQLLHYDGRFWRGYTYAWNDQQTDAELVESQGRERTCEVVDAAAPGGTRRQTWHYSSRVECARCHNQWAEYALAFNPRQLTGAGPQSGGSCQLQSFRNIGLVELPEAAAETAATDSPPSPDHMPYSQFVNPYDESAELNPRARSWLHVNCAHCHRLGGGGSAYLELREELRLDEMKVVDVRPTQGTFGIAEARIVAAGDPFRSTLFFRISKTGSGRMPHIGSELVDTRGVQLISDWIQQLPRNSDTTVLLTRLNELDEGLWAARDNEQTLSRDQGQAATGQVNRDQQRQTLLSSLLSSTRHALALSQALARNELHPQVRAQAIEAGAARAEPQLRDLFEQFLPAERRVRRLGSMVRAEQLLAMTGDPIRGRELFLHNAGVGCRNCHRVGEIGGKLGPDLTLIAGKYSRAQLLDSILEPSKVIDPKYVSYVVHTNDGQVHSGLLSDRTQQEVVLRNARDEVVRIPLETVEEIAPQRQSIMPELLLKDMTAEQVADLLEFLAGLK